MIPVFPVSRLGFRLEKAEKGGQAAHHKYIKREPYFSGGKLRWRYYYADDLKRQKHQKELDPGEDHDHRLEHDARRIHHNLRTDRPKTSELTAEYIEQTLGNKAKVKFSAKFERQFRQPHIDEEQAGVEVRRNPTQRVAQAFEMLPDSVVKLLNIKNVKLTTRDDRKLKEMFEQDEPSRPVPAAFSDKDGNFFLCADDKGRGFNSEPHGWPKFGSSLTLSEEIVWHEVGRQLRFSVANKRPQMWREWKQLVSGGTSTDEPISAIALRGAEDDFAESFACALSHPKQLAQQAPDRYEFFRRHGLMEQDKTAEQMVNESDENLAWWGGRKKTKAEKVANKLRDQESVHTAPYISEKDEFLQMTVGGRTIYIRYGPDSSEDEANWETMPDVIDEETGFPRYDTELSNAFRAASKLKEIYDEHGNRLTDASAFFYLAQNDEKLNTKLPDDLEGFTPKANMHLARTLFDKLGENRGDDEKERKAYHAHIKKEMKAGKTKEEARQSWAEKRKSRFEWMPVKIPKEQFHAKTPSFAFHGLKSAENQPFKALQNGKPVIDPETGKERLTARIYQAVNPDGSKAELAVQEASTFTYGENVLLPVTRYQTDEDTGETRQVTQWKRVTLDPHKHPDISLSGLAKEYKVPLDELKQRNGKFGQYQLLDPLMASLINPAHTPIKSEADLYSLIKAAADAKPEKWVSMQIGSDIPPSVVHAKVKFDGAGSPLLMGDYWARKIGKPNPRVSDLLKSGGELKRVERVQERKPRKPKIKEGNVVSVRYRDRWVYARLHERYNNDRGKKRYDVEILEGQGVEEDDRQITVNRVRAVPSNIDPEKPDVRFRDIKQPMHDVALYADEVRVDRNGEVIPGTGVVKMKLPRDGSYNFEEMVRAPGVRTNDKGELLFDPSKLDEFREHVGGFIADDHVQRRLNGMVREAKSRSMGLRNPKVSLTDIVDPLNGNAVRTDGLLKGMNEFIGDNRFALGQHQAEALQAIAQNDGRLLLAHFMGTGKTVTAIAAIKMMQNMRDPDDPSKPHAKAPKRVCVVVPRQTADQWVDAVSEFTDGKATLLHSNLPGGVGAWIPPDHLKTKPPGMSDEEYHAKLDEERKKAQEKNPKLWRPQDDNSDIVVVPEDYWQKHQAELKRSGGFDGIIVDEAQGIQRENKRSQAVEEWNPDMKMMLMLTGTPFTNKLNTLPRYAKLVSNGQLDFGAENEFEKEHMIESSVMRAAGSRNAEKMDLNPQSAPKIASQLKPYVHVATTADVRGKVLPAVLMDENKPAHMKGVQQTIYRGYMESLTDEDRERLERAATLGEDERAAFKNRPEGLKRILSARHITNTPAYKPPDGNEYVRFELPSEEKGKGKSKTKKVEFELPSWGELSKKYKGKWPSHQDVANGKLHQNEYNEIAKWVGYALGRDYSELAGKSLSDTLSDKELKAVRSGDELNGLQFGRRVANPEYGPEGSVCRGQMGPDGRIRDLEYTVRNPDGSVKETVKVPVGLRFIRNPQKKGQGDYYIAGLPSDHEHAGDYPSDWDYSKPVHDVIEGEGEAKKTEKGQKPLEGREDMSVNRSPARRRERLMFDLTMTHGNAKADEFEKTVHDSLDPSTGGDPNQQMVLFGEKIGSSFRTMESKLRLMGYQDINEVLNHDLHAEDDPYPKNGKYFVGYAGGAELGNRDINSEIFKKKKDSNGRDTDTSMMVYRTLHGTSGKPLKPGQISTGWTAAQRNDINKLFTNVEMPARVTAIETESGIEHRYLYESRMNAKDRKEFRAAEKAQEQATSKAERDKAEQRIKKLAKKYWTADKPLNDHQIGVFNNCQFMVASDAAQTGMNWGNASKEVMWDSLFSPMDEMQRVTRIARMLPPAVKNQLMPHFQKVSEKIDQMEKSTGLSEFEGAEDQALLVVEKALDDMPETREALMQSGKNPEQIAEVFLAQRTLDRISGLRGPVEERLRQDGRTLTNAPKIQDPQTGEERYQRVSPDEITQNDVMNEILEGELKPYERAVLRSRGYMVDVKRLTTSVEIPKFEARTVKDPVTGEKQTKRVQVGTQIEYPSKAERSVMVRQRAKSKPIENMFSLLQSQEPSTTSYDFQTTTPSSLSKFGTPVDPAKSQEQLQAEEARKRERKEEYKRIRAKERAERKRIARERREREKAEKKARKQSKTKKSFFVPRWR